MDTCLYLGDHQRDHRGLPFSISGTEELLQQAMIRLSVRRGAFPLNPQLGSRLHTLSPNDPGLNDTALRLAQEALCEMNDIAVTKASCTVTPPEGMTAELFLTVGRQEETLTVAVAL